MPCGPHAADSPTWDMGSVITNTAIHANPAKRKSLHVTPLLRSETSCGGMVVRHLGLLKEAGCKSRLTAPQGPALIQRVETRDPHATTSLGLQHLQHFTSAFVLALQAQGTAR
ncbi:hypothetical protein E4U61_002603 [Claviceps capensis]|nr:hypothetical protein E4U61_002603 [Claviceps capensis]